jgi:hypothetical protein
MMIPTPTPRSTSLRVLLGALGNADLTAADVDGEDARASAVGG